jgi:hypothetical protein
MSNIAIHQSRFQGVSCSCLISLRPGDGKRWKEANRRMRQTIEMDVSEMQQLLHPSEQGAWLFVYGNEGHNYLAV